MVYSLALIISSHLDAKYSLSAMDSLPAISVRRFTLYGFVEYLIFSKSFIIKHINIGQILMLVNLIYKVHLTAALKMI